MVSKGEDENNGSDGDPGSVRSSSRWPCSVCRRGW